RELSGAGDLLDEFVRGTQFLGRPEQFGLVESAQSLDLTADGTHVAGGLDDVTGAGLTLGTDQCGTLGDATQALTEVGGTRHEQHAEGPLVDVMGLEPR